MKKVSKKILISGIFVSLIGVFSITSIVKTIAETKYCGSTSECFVNAGSGTDDDPYRISTPEQLNAIRYDLEASYVLENDIDLTYDTQNKNGLFYNNGLGWEAIGTRPTSYFSSELAFAGILDGNNHFIIGLYSNSTTLSYNGLFGYAKDATIKNIKLKNANVNNEADIGYMCQNTSNDASGSSTDSIAGILVGATTNTLIENVRVAGIVNAYKAGGIVGCAGYNSTIKNSYNIARVVGTRSGGISATASGATLENVYNAGEIGKNDGRKNGGIASSLNYNGKIINAYNTGFVYGAGIVGGTSGAGDELINLVSNVYNLGIVTKSNIIEEIYTDTTVSNAYGYIRDDDITDYNNTLTKVNYQTYSVEMLKNKNVYAGFDFNNVWEIDYSTGYNYPKLKNVEHVELEEENNFSGGIGKVYNPYQVATPTQLDEIRNYQGRSFVLKNDIDLTYDTQNIDGLFYNEGTGWNSIGISGSSFLGVFDGNGHKIIGLYANKTAESGLFGSVLYSSIYNVVMKDVNIISTGDKVAGLASRVSSSKIENIVVDGNIQGSWYIGGIVGQSYYSTLTGLVNLSDVKSSNYTGGIVGGLYGGILKNSYNVGQVSSSSYAGGLVGNHNSYNSTTRECYNIGPVISNNKGSGLVIGYGGGNISNVYSLDFGKEMIGVTSDNLNISNVYTKTIDELKDKNTYLTWDNFDDNFKIETVNNITHFPVLKTNNTSYIDKISTVDKINLTVNGKLQSTTLNYEIDSNGVYSDDLIIKSKDESIVSVDLDGTIKAVAPGNTSLDIYGYDGYHINIPVEVLEITYTSDKYDLSNPYIFVGGGELDLNSINVTNGTKKYEDYKLTILDGEYVVKEFDIIKLSSNKVNVDNEYLLRGSSDISVINGIMQNGTEVRYNKNNQNILVYKYKQSQFMDQNLYNCVVDSYNATNGIKIPYTKYLDEEALKTITSLECNGLNKSQDKKITNGGGLSSLEELTELHLENNNIGTINLRSNKKLKKLYIDNSNATYTYVYDLEILSAKNNPEITFQSTEWESLKEVYLSGSGGVVLAKYLNLEILDLNSCNTCNISSIDLSNKVNLKELYIQNNKLTSLDVSKNVNLIKLDASNNNIGKLDVSNNLALEDLKISNNQLKELDINNNDKLTNLEVDGNQFTQSVVVYKNDKIALSNENIKLPEGKSSSLIKFNNSDVLTGEIYATTAGKNEYVLQYGHNIQSNNNTYEVKLNLIVIEATLAVHNEEFELNADKGYIYTGTTTFNYNETYFLNLNYGKATNVNNKFIISFNDKVIKELDIINVKSSKYYLENRNYIYLGVSNLKLESISVTNADKKIYNNKLLIKHNNDIVKSFNLIGISSDEYEIKDDYIYVVNKSFDLEKVNVSNATKNFDNNTLEIEYDGNILGSFSVINVSSDKYDLTKDYIYIGVDDLDIKSINAINAVVASSSKRLVIYHDHNEVKSYDLISLSSDSYDLSKNYIYLNNESFDINKINVINATKDFDGSSFKIKYNNELVKTFDVVNVSSSKYDLNKNYIYTGTNDLSLEDINVTNGEKFAEDSKLKIKYNDNILKEYDLIKISSEKYDLTKGYIFDNDFNVDNITLTNGTKEVEGNKLLIKYDGELLQSYDIVSVNSNKYDLNRNYIYTGTNDLSLEDINIINGQKSIEDNKLLVKYNDDLLKEYQVISINFGEYKTYDGLLVLPENTTYEQFTNNITTNGVTYKLFSGETEITEGNISKGMIIKIYYRDEAIDKYEVTNEYLELDESLNIDNEVNIIEKLPRNLKLKDFISLINTSGSIEVRNNNNELLSDDSNIGTGSKLKITLSNRVVEYTLSVRGDVTGNGQAKMADVMKIATHIIEGNVISGDAFERAADITGDGKIKMNDVMKLATFIIDGGEL